MKFTFGDPHEKKWGGSIYCLLTFDDEIDREFNDIVNNKIFYNADHIEKIFVEKTTEPLPHLEVEKMYKKTENI